MRWQVHALLPNIDRGSGTVQWLQSKLVCPCFDVNWTAAADGPWDKETCCNRAAWHESPGGRRTAAANGCAAGCEQYRAVLGVDEVMTNSDLGLYRSFQTVGGVPTGCAGLAKHNLTGWLEKWRYRNATRLSPLEKQILSSSRGDRITSPAPDWDASQCALNDLEEPKGSTPMFRLVEEYAASNDAFVADALPALERILSNGYASDELVTAPMEPHQCEFVDDTNEWHREYRCV